MSLNNNTYLVFFLLLIAGVPASSNALWNTKVAKKETDKVLQVDKETVTIKGEANSHGLVHDEIPVEYGVDVTFPVHHDKVSTNYPWLPHNIDPSIQTPRQYEGMVVQPLGDRQKVYDDFLQSCVDKFGPQGDRCRLNEQDRIAMSLRQPRSMQNYTEVGFKKIKAPDELWSLLSTFWEKNKHNAKAEQWGIGNTYTNNWVSPTDMVSVEDTSLRGGGNSLKQKIWDAARATIQEWTGEELTQCSLYGIRIYKTGSILAPHVDRLPLVSSAIINVAQDVDEPWLLEVISHDGKAHNVTMEAGDMVLYESHSVLHGRPFPLKGRFMANIFIHFEPTGHSLRHNARVAEEHGKNVHEKYRDALKRGVAGHENDVDHNDLLPIYILPGTPESKHWKQLHPSGKRSQVKSFSTGSTPAHFAAQVNDLKALKKAVESRKGVVNSRDENGWTPLHEGARFGHTDVVKFLLENGADLNARTGNENGGTPLWWAQHQVGNDHPVVRLLEAAGALSLGPEL